MRPTSSAAPKPDVRAGRHEPQRPRASVMVRVGDGWPRARTQASVRSVSTRRASALRARTTARTKASPSPETTSARGWSPAASRQRGRPGARSRRQGRPKTSMRAPGTSGVVWGSSASRAAIQARRSRAKAAASPRRRGLGAVATTSRRAASSRRLTRRARPLTLSRTAAPSTSIRSPSA